MKLSKNNRRFSKGYTLIEMAAVIAVLLALIGVLLVGIQGYIAGVNRANCVLNLSNIQKAMRSYAAMYQVPIGGALTKSEPRFVGTNGMLPQEPTCPAGGTYTWGTTIPPVGTAYVTCSIAGHAPLSTAGW